MNGSLCSNRGVRLVGLAVLVLAAACAEPKGSAPAAVQYVQVPGDVGQTWEYDITVVDAGDAPVFVSEATEDTLLEWTPQGIQWTAQLVDRTGDPEWLRWLRSRAHKLVAFILGEPQASEDTFCIYEVNAEDVDLGSETCVIRWTPESQ